MNEAVAERLLDALVVRLNAVAPPGFTARSEGGWLMFGKGTAFIGGFGVASLLDQEGNLDELVTRVTEQALSTVQDWIADDLTIPWPAEAHNLPMPGARIVGDVLELWYGDTAVSAPGSHPAGRRSLLTVRDRNALKGSLRHKPALTCRIAASGRPER